VFSVAISPDGKKIISGSGDNTVKLWDAVTDNLLAVEADGHEGHMVAVALQRGVAVSGLAASTFQSCR
jgi:WD40 repeat protein